MKIAIIGFGNEGKSLLQFLQKSPRYKNAAITVLDKNPARAEELRKSGVPSEWGDAYLKNLDRYDIIFRSPGVPYLLPEIQRAKKHRVIISSQTKLFFEELAAHKAKNKTKKPVIIGVTGSKGKGTTSMLIFQMLKKAGYKAVLAGNIGISMITALPRAKKADYVVLELSSFQLQDMALSSDIAVVVDIFPDHLDVHKNLAEYYDAKANIGRFQKTTDAIFYFANNAASMRIASKSPARAYPLTLSYNTLRKNSAMASAVARICGVSRATVNIVIKKFKGLEHRLEFVKKIRSVAFYNDSAGTNPIATAAAIVSYKDPIVLIAGGRDKGLAYAPLALALKKSTAQCVILFGENKTKIAHALQNIKRPIIIVENLREAVKTAFARAQELAEHRESAVVIFSPAAASFDMFSNYQERGETFKRLVRKLK